MNNDIELETDEPAPAPAPDFQKEASASSTTKTNALWKKYKKYLPFAIIGGVALIFLYLKSKTGTGTGTGSIASGSSGTSGSNGTGSGTSDSGSGSGSGASGSGGITPIYLGGGNGATSNTGNPQTGTTSNTTQQLPAQQVAQVAPKVGGNNPYIPPTITPQPQPQPAPQVVNKQGFQTPGVGQTVTINNQPVTGVTREQAKQAITTANVVQPNGQVYASNPSGKIDASPSYNSAVDAAGGVYQDHVFVPGSYGAKTKSTSTFVPSTPTVTPSSQLIDQGLPPSVVAQIQASQQLATQVASRPTPKPVKQVSAVSLKKVNPQPPKKKPQPKPTSKVASQRFRRTNAF